MSYLFPFIQFVDSLLDIYSFLLITWVIINLLEHFNIINGRHIIITKVIRFLDALFNPPLRLLRRFIPIIGGVDITPVILFLLIKLIKVMLFTFLY